jgi:hypothetical protein
MSRLLSILLAFILLAATACADDLPDPATLPETQKKGDMPTEYPAEMARRLRAGKALLESGELEKAQEELKLAEKASAHQMVYFYQAVVAYRLGDYPRALNRAKEGLGVLSDIDNYGDPTPQTEAQEKRFQELRDAIQAKLDATGGKAAEDPRKVKQEFEAARQAGDTAFGNGLFAKAATEYARAYRRDPTQAEIGLRAATLYADRLKNPLEAARLWQMILAAGEPHASTARAELQSHRDVLDAVLREGLAKRDQWRSRLDETEPLRLAEAFPESAELQIELAVIFARKGPADRIIAHLQSASRLGLTADDFLARKEFIEYLQQSGGLENPRNQDLAAFVRDAYGEETLTAMRTELKHRADEIARIAREKAEAERQAKLAKELKELTTWRNAERAKLVNEVNSLISNRNDIPVEMVNIQPGKKKTTRNTIARSNSLSFENGRYVFKLFTRSTVYRFSTGSVSPTADEDLVTTSSLAGLNAIEYWATSWDGLPAKIGDPDITSLPADPGQRALCKEIQLSLNGTVNVHHRQTETYEFETSDGSKRSVFEHDLNLINILAMLTDDEAIRVKILFQQLSGLDAAGNNVGKLRQLKQ